jgi:hypothetical protein
VLLTGADGTHLEALLDFEAARLDELLQNSAAVQLLNHTHLSIMSSFREIREIHTPRKNNPLYGIKHMQLSHLNF